MRWAVRHHLYSHGTPSEAWGRAVGRVDPYVTPYKGAREMGLNARSSPLSFIPLVAFTCALFMRQGRQGNFKATPLASSAAERTAPPAAAAACCPARALPLMPYAQGRGQYWLASLKGQGNVGNAFGNAACRDGMERDLPCRFLLMPVAVL